MRARFKPLTWTLTAVFFLQSVWTPATQGKDLFQSLFRIQKPEAPEDPCVEQLAEEIDWLEKHIDNYGSVVAKQPDVWGQARLTKHRQEYEEQLRAELNQFEVTFNAAISRSDQAFLGSALALQAAVSPGATRPEATSTAQVEAMISDPTKEESKVIVRSGPFALPVPKYFGESTELKLEPTTTLNQLSRYLQHLHELRRINEGDDTADSPGYALNLVRIAVSLLPGRTTRKGYGAEITITAEPYLSEDLLPTTFRSLLVNDLVNQLGLSITRIADGKLWETYKEQVEAYNAALEKECETRKRLEAARAHEESVRPKSAQFAPNQAFLDAQKTRKELEHQQSQAQSAFAAAAKEVGKVRNQPVTLPMSRSRQSTNPVPPSQLADVFGVDELMLVGREFYISYQGPNVRWMEDDPHQRVLLLDVQRYLQAELDAAHELLKRCSHTGIMEEFIGSCGGVPDCKGLAEEIRSGHLTEVNRVRQRFFARLHEGEQLPDSECKAKTPIDALAWAIVVESALLQDRLAEDMQRAAVAKGCRCGCGPGGETHAYYLPNPTLEARLAFNEYVRCRWPIHVFALDPVAETQNVEDAFSRRRELQLALAMSFAADQISAQTMTRFARRLEMDMAAIALNHTIVGFSHGEDTFGWRFFPRVQTPPTHGTIRTIGETLFGGPTPDCDLLERQIEPGMRECVAIVIMPSFVPYCTFDVRSNWFRLTHREGWLPTRHDTEISMKDTVQLSRSIKTMHTQAQLICDAHMYRDGEVVRLLKRVGQLDRELPLQSMQVQVPIENTLGGFEMFSNGVTDLAPELAGWYGAPGILLTEPAMGKEATCPAKEEAKQPAAGEGATAGAGNGRPPKFQPPLDCQCPGTTLFLVGDHFSVHDTKVIAGGRCIPYYTLISRQIMRVTIPPDVNPVIVDKNEYVDVHVATPYGVTSHLHIPTYRPKQKPKAPKLVWESEVYAAVAERDDDRCPGMVRFEIDGCRGQRLGLEFDGPRPPEEVVIGPWTIEFKNGATMEIIDAARLDLQPAGSDKVRYLLLKAKHGDESLQSKLNALVEKRNGVSIKNPPVRVSGVTKVKMDDGSTAEASGPLVINVKPSCDDDCDEDDDDEAAASRLQRVRRLPDPRFTAGDVVDDRVGKNGAAVEPARADDARHVTSHPLPPPIVAPQN